MSCSFTNALLGCRIGPIAIGRAHARSSDGRRQLLIYMLPDVVKDLKRAALDEDRPAYELAEEAILDWLLKRRKRNK
jgi:hypothetical protein